MKTKNSRRKQKYPPGWNEKRVRAVIDHYENQTEEEQVAEIEAVMNDANITMMAIPTELVPQVRDLIANGKRTPSESRRRSLGSGNGAKR